MKTVKCCCSYWKCITYNKLFALVRGLKAVLEASISPVFNLCKCLYTEVRFFFWVFLGGLSALSLPLSNQTFKLLTGKGAHV